MSLAEEARVVRGRLVERIAELEPLVDEYNELRELLAEFGEAPARATPRSGSRGRARGGQERRPRGAKARATGRAGEVLELIQARPGMTVAQVGKQIGADPTSLYRVIRKLESEGLVTKKGRQLYTGD